MATHETYMHRCLQLARLGAGNVAPNPMVGSLLVYEGRIIGEGYHQRYGGPHAEVHCLNSVAESDRHLVSRSTIYVSLEPCAHFGKTPPCADLIIHHRIPKAVIGCRDSFVEVDGKGIEKLRQAGVDITVGILENDCLRLNRRFFTSHTQQRPFIILKWARSSDGMIASNGGGRTLISNAYSNRLVHRWRSEEAAIMVGTNTALADDPSLTTRFWIGKNPLRIVLDMHLRLPQTLQLFTDGLPTIIFNTIMETTGNQTEWALLDEGADPLPQILDRLYAKNIQSVIIEGGRRLLQSFIDQDLYDEVRIIHNRDLIIGDGIPAPTLRPLQLSKRYQLQGDEVTIYHRMP